MSDKPGPKYPLDTYRQFIRDAAAFISLVAGRKIKASEAETMSDDDLTKLAILIDQRVDDLKRRPPPARGDH